MLDKVTIEANEIDWDSLPTRFMNPRELETICHLVRSVNAQTVLEFGINTGRTAKAILRECPAVENYIGVDVLPGYLTAKQVQRKEVPIEAGELVKDDARVQLLVKPQGSYELCPADLPECDVAFIDGDHSLQGVAHDTALARAVVRKGGIIIWHDYNEVMKHGQYVVDVKEFLDEYSESNDVKHVEGTWLAYQRM